MSSNPPKAYVVRIGDYEDERILGVFSSMKLAKAAIAPLLEARKAKVAASAEYIRVHHLESIYKTSPFSRKIPTTEEAADRSVPAPWITSFDLDPETISDN